MKTVNHIIFGTSLFPALPSEQHWGVKWRKDRSKQLDTVMHDAFDEIINADEYARDISGEATAKYAKTIPNFGERSVQELICCLAIWLTQLSPSEVEQVQMARRQRERFVPKKVEKAKL